MPPEWQWDGALVRQLKENVTLIVQIATWQGMATILVPVPKHSQTSCCHDCEMSKVQKLHAMRLNVYDEVFNSLRCDSVASVSAYLRLTCLVTEKRTDWGLQSWCLDAFQPGVMTISRRVSGFSSRSCADSNANVSSYRSCWRSRTCVDVHTSSTVFDDDTSTHSLATDDSWPVTWAMTGLLLKPLTIYLHNIQTEVTEMNK